MCFKINVLEDLMNRFPEKLAIYFRDSFIKVGQIWLVEIGRENKHEFLVN